MRTYKLDAVLLLYGVAEDKVREVMSFARNNDLVLVERSWCERMQRLDEVIQEIAKGAVDNG